MFNACRSVSLVAFLLLSASVVNGASTGVLTGLLLNRLHEFQILNHAKRQSGSNGSGSGISVTSFPQPCQSGCEVSVNALNTCTAASCLCTADVDRSLDFCINCTVNILPDPTVIQDGQQVFDDYNALCKGMPGINTLSLSGVTLPSTSTATSTFINPFLPATTVTTTQLKPPLGPKTTITAGPQTTNTDTSTGTVVNPTTTSKVSNPLSGNDAVALPRASKAYAAVGLVVAFFMCLA